MKLFSMLESIFFITLGICCVLLMMLIYHFKQRLSKVEQSNETMFEILNNMVHELSEIKRMYGFSNMQTIPTHTIDNRIPVSLDQDDDESQDTSSLPDLVSNQPADEYDSDESVSELDNESGSELDSESESESDSDDEDEIKLVNVEIDDSLDTVDDADEHNDNNNFDDEELEAVEINTSHVESIQINKVENAEDLEEPAQYSVNSVNSREVYKKMNVPSLKALVIEKGLISDPGKLKKQELIDLLESV